MPKSKVRKKTAYTPPSADRHTPAKVRAAGPSPLIYKIVMFGLMLLGLAWLVVQYLAREQIPVMRDLENWNFVVGFALLITGLLMTMRWR